MIKNIQQCMDESEAQNVIFKQIVSAVFYGVASFMITVIMLRSTRQILRCPNCTEIITSKSLLDDISSREFEKDFNEHHIPITLFQRSLLTLGSAGMSLLDPYRGDMIACFGETAGTHALKYMRNKMENSPEGVEILKARPRINLKTVDLDKLRRMPEGTLGNIYIKFLDENQVTPDSRTVVQFVDDINLAYVIQRYRESHDLIHALLGMKTNMLGEIAVKWVEALQTRLPMCVGGALFGPLRLKTKNRRDYLNYYLPWAIQTGTHSKFLLNVYFEKRWEQPLTELHEEFNIKSLVLPK